MAWLAARGFLDPHNFRRRVFAPIVEKALGMGRRFTPHGLRHTFASLHLARRTKLRWIQAQGGWASAKVLLDWYGHFLPTETTGYADALTGGTERHQAAPVPRRQERPRAPARDSRSNGGLRWRPGQESDLRTAA